MRGLRCLDGSDLAVVPVASLDRGGNPFEVTLELRRDGDSFGSVGERCGYFLADLARRVAEARTDGSAQAARWPDPDDRFPDPSPGDPSREPELFAFRYRDRGDVISTGELRCALRTSSMWLGGQQSAAGRWRVARRAVLEAWGAGGRGVRAVLTSADLARFLAELLAQADREVPGGVGGRPPAAARPEQATALGRSIPRVSLT
ncbi:hypothetical protein ACFOY4_11685 [Actinomadura syzygii]|uniref:hypothetical protein n=1 Tax=Actinomadura syzygii TaxID=1427538 RepID=UPI001FE8437F|nr:hypothetical protein [Actinomadura syzygii]